MDISTILRIWLKYPYNIHEEINKYLGIISITSTQPPKKKPCLYSWLKYPYNIQQNIFEYLEIDSTQFTQSIKKKPCLYKEVVFTSGKIIGRVCITKKITKKSLKKDIHELLVNYNPSVDNYDEFTHKIFISWTQSIDEVLDEDLYKLIVDSKDELCICPGFCDVLNIEMIVRNYNVLSFFNSHAGYRYS